MYAFGDVLEGSAAHLLLECFELPSVHPLRRLDLALNGPAEDPLVHRGVGRPELRELHAEPALDALMMRVCCFDLWNHVFRHNPHRRLLVSFQLRDHGGLSSGLLLRRRLLDNYLPRRLIHQQPGVGGLATCDCLVVSTLNVGQRHHGLCDVG